MSQARGRSRQVQPFHLESISAGDCAVLRVAGEIDVYTAPELRERVIRFIDDGTRHVIADLRDVDFLDSTGLGALVGSLKRLRCARIARARDQRRPDPADLPDHRAHRAFALHSSVPDAITADQHWQAALARCPTAGRG